MQVLFELISAILQITVFSIIPFTVFLFRRDKSVSFFQYIGFYKPTSKAVLYVLIAVSLTVAAGVGLLLFNDDIRQIVLTPPSVTGKLREGGLTTATILTLLIIAWLKTSLSEEIFFRGFIAKRLIHWLGFNAGNLLQSLIFGIVHLVLFWALTKVGPMPLLIIFCFSSAAGWTIGYIKEKVANGSMIPGWIAHGFGNMVSYAIIVFVL